MQCNFLLKKTPIFFVKKYSGIENISLITFSIFLFFSIIFCNFTKVNNIFHVSCILLFISLLTRGQIYRDILQNWIILVGLSLIFLIAAYFTFSSILNESIRNALSILTHSLYLIAFMLLATLSLQNINRHTIMVIVIAGVTILSIFTILTNANQVIYYRKLSYFNLGPNNIIDLSGYCVISIIISMILSQEKSNNSYLLLIIIPSIMLVMTQSRGPILSLVVISLLIFSKQKCMFRLLFFGLLLLLISFLIFSPVGKLLLFRFYNLEKEFWLRINIWRYILTQVNLHPWFGMGFSKNLDFINYDGSYITTAHSVYFGALYKGGIVGFGLFILLLGYGLFCSVYAYKISCYIDLALYLFMLIFISSQGMFIISNPRETWILFWLPLAVAFSAGSKSYFNILPYK